MVTAMTETKTALGTVAVSTKTSPKAAAKKRAKRTRTKLERAIGEGSTGGKPASLEEARQDLLRQVCSQSRAITRAVVKEALAGKYLCARFLFEAVGLCAIKGDELEEVAERESLASLLMKQWQLPTQRVDAGDAAVDQVTEVSETARGLALAEEAPVKS